MYYTVLSKLWKNHTSDTRVFISKVSIYFRYPEKWYQDVTSGTRYYSLAAVHPHDGHIIGMIVCDVRTLNQINREVCTTVGTCISLEKKLIQVIIGYTILIQT